MTGWIIFGSILLVLILIFAQSVAVTAIYDKNPELRVKILFFTIVKVPPDPEKQKKKAAKLAAKEEKKRRKEAKKAWKEARKHPHGNSALLQMAEESEQTPDETDGSGENSENAESSENAETTETAKKGRKEKPPKKAKRKMELPSLDMIRDYIKSASPPIKRLFKKIRIRDVYIDCVVGSDDAAKTALKYGGFCSAIYSLTGFLRTYMDTKVKEINIEADFSAEKDDIFAYVTVKLRISTAIGCALWLGVRVLKTYLKYNKSSAPKHKGKPRPARA